MENGKCHICGEITKLSFEHVPPKAAYNGRTVLKSTPQDLLNQPPDTSVNHTISQRGAGEFTLCEKCNNLTGKWYGGEYVNMVQTALLALNQVYKDSIVLHTGRFYPLRFIKQTMSLFCSINSPEFTESNQELREFILNKEKKHLPSNMFISMYLNLKGYGRFFPFTAKGDLHLDFEIISEFTFPPFGFVFSLDKPPKSEKLLDIRYFSYYGYEDEAVLFLPLYILHTYSHFPCDYRTVYQIKADRIETMIKQFIKDENELSPEEKASFKKQVINASENLHKNL